MQACAKKIHAASGPGILRHPNYRQALIEASIVTNAALAAHSIRQEIRQTEIQVAYGIYLLETRQVWTPYARGMKVGGLAPAPRDAAAFTELGDAILHSDRIASLIKTKG